MDWDSYAYSGAPMKKNPAAVALGRLGGRKGGKAKTEAKKAASRANGAKGGRPRKDKALDRQSAKLLPNDINQRLRH